MSDTQVNDWNDYEGFADEDDTQSETEVSVGPEEGTPDAGDLPEEEVGDEEAAPPEAMFTVKVNGAEVEVPLSELLAGYSRTADYTRKSQALAEQRRAVADAEALLVALERDPVRAIQALQASYLGGAAAAPEDEYLTDEQREIRELRAWQQQEVARQREAQIDMQVSRLRQEYGDFDEEALFRFAVERNIMDLDVALRAMSYDTVAQQRQSAQAAQAQQKQAQKRSAGAAVPGNGSRQATSIPAENMEIRTMRDAYEYAKQRTRT